MPLWVFLRAKKETIIIPLEVEDVCFADSLAINIKIFAPKDNDGFPSPTATSKLKSIINEQLILAAPFFSKHHSSISAPVNKPVYHPGVEYCKENAPTSYT